MEYRYIFVQNTYQSGSISRIGYGIAVVTEQKGKRPYEIQTDYLGKETKLFLLEKTYYFYAISSSNGFLQTELFDNLGGFVKICGYVKMSDVVKCDTTPVLPYYPTETLTVKQSNAILKAQPDLNGDDIAVALNGQNVCFYGRSCQNSDWYYVKYQNDFGYVQSRQLSTLLVAPHPTPIATPEPTPPDDEQTIEKTDIICYNKLIINILISRGMFFYVRTFKMEYNQKKKRENR